MILEAGDCCSIMQCAFGSFVCFAAALTFVVFRSYVSFILVYTGANLFVFN